MKTKILAVFLLIISTSLSAQINTTLNRNYGGPGIDNITRFYQASDGGFFWCGYSNAAGGDIPQNNGLTDAWFMKVDANGDSLHSVAFGGLANDEIADVMEFSSPDYVFLINSNSDDNGFAGGHGGIDTWIKGYDPAVGLSSGAAIGGTLHDFGAKISPKISGGNIVSGYTISSDGNLSGHYGMSDIWVMSLQSNLSVAWSRHYGGTDDDRAIAAYQLGDGNIMVFGTSASTNHDVHDANGNTDVFVMKLNSLGDTLWTKTYGGSLTDIIIDAKYLNDSTFVMIGYSNSNNGDFMFRDKVLAYYGFYYVIDENGDFVSCGSQNTLDNKDLFFSDVIYEGLNQAMAFGTTISDSLLNCTTPTHGSLDVCAVDFNGSTSITPYLLGGNNIDGMNSDVEYYVRAVKTGTNQYALCTNSNSTDLSADYHGLYDVWLSFIEVQHVSVPEAPQLQLSVYPNPAENIIMIDNITAGNDSQFEIYDMQGKLLLSGQYSESGIDVSSLEHGMYLLKLQSGDSTGIARIVKQ
ncbi:MAG: T9SS type A sorting domain-containing protein [Bacteroidales bacterium]